MPIIYLQPKDILPLPRQGSKVKATKMCQCYLSETEAWQICVAAAKGQGQNSVTFSIENEPYGNDSQVPYRTRHKKRRILIQSSG